LTPILAHDRDLRRIKTVRDAGAFGSWPAGQRAFMPFL